MKKMKYYQFLSIAFISLTFLSCGKGNNSTSVNVRETQKPAMLVIPSDQLLQRFNAIKTEDALGKSIQVRDYNGYLLSDPDSKFIISTVQSEFINFGYPLNDLEQLLKSINDQEILDEVTGVKKDAKTILLTNAKPDIILDLDYGFNINHATRDYTKTFTYTLRAIDAFSNKVVASIQQADINIEKSQTISGIIAGAIKSQSKDFTAQINNYFDDLIANGRDISVRIVIDANENFILSDESIYGDTYADYILDYLKVNTIMGAYTLQRNTDTEMLFRNVRIKTLNDNGTQYSAYDFARDLSRMLNKECGVKSKNATQGLGDAMIIIKGM